MKKTVLTIVVACLFAVLPLAASGQQDAAASDALINKTGFPIVNEPVTLNFVATQHPWSRPWGEMPMFQQYEEQSGVHIEWAMIPQSDRVEKVNLLLAAGDLPDVAFVPGLAGRMGEAVADGIVMPLNDLIEEWAPQMQKLFSEQPNVRPSITYPDGEIYGFPRYHNTSHHQLTSRQWYINEKWVANLGLSMPETIDDFYTYLKAIKNGDPNGNGDTNDEIPLAFWTRGSGDIAEWITLFGSWGVVDTIMLADGQAYWGFLDDGFREGAKFFRKLYTEGLMDIESISQTMNQVKAKAEVDGVPVLGASYALAPQFLFKNPDLIFKYKDSFGTRRYLSELEINPLREIGVMMPPAGPDGDRLWQYTVGGGMIGRDVAVMFEDARYPEVITRWMDSWYDGAEMGQTMLLGPIGVRWYVDEETGDYQNIDPPEGMNKNEHRAQHCPGSGGYNVGYYDRYGKITKPPYPEHMMLEEQTELYLDYVPEESWPANFIMATLDEIDFLSQYEQEMMNYVWESLAKFIADPETDIDAEWSDYVSQVKRMKADEILKVKQDQYDRYLANFE